MEQLAINYSLNNTFYSTSLSQVVSGGTYMSDVTNNVQLVQYTIPAVDIEVRQFTTCQYITEY